MKKLFALALVMFLFTGCSTGMKNEVSHEKSQMGALHSRQHMIEKTYSILEKTPNLTNDQREKFLGLHTEVMDKVANYSQDIRKLKVMLFSEMTAKNYQSDKVQEITSQIKSLYNKRLDVMLDTMGEAKSILGVEAENTYIKELMEQHYQL